MLSMSLPRVQPVSPVVIQKTKHRLRAPMVGRFGSKFKKINKVDSPKNKSTKWAKSEGGMPTLSISISFIKFHFRFHH